jgi:photosystem II stability/assembly factor-like uncharacterized protein
VVLTRLATQLRKALPQAAALLWIATTFCGRALSQQPQFNVDSFSYSTSQHEVTNTFFLGEVYGWMAATDHQTDEGYVLRTQDGGSSWHSFKAPSHIKQLLFISPARGWALRSVNNSQAGRTTFSIFVTNDGGEHWASASNTPVIASTRQNYRSVGSPGLAFINKMHGWLVEGPAHSCHVMESLDGGHSFETMVNLPPGLTDCTSVYARPDIGVLIIGTDYVLLSRDEGKSWKSVVHPESLGISPELFDMASATFLKNGHGWLAGQGYRGNGTILRSEDFGRSWRLEFGADVATNFKSLWATDGKHRCAVGYTSLLFCTSDDGASWVSRDVLPPRLRGQSDYFGNLVLFASGRGWVVRFGGYLYGTTDGGQTWHELDPLNMP